jgi:hypothetical protein
MADGKCFACGKKLGKTPQLVTCEDEQDVFVGRECYKLIKASGKDGYAPTGNHGRGGPRLFTLPNDPKGSREEAQ